MTEDYITLHYEDFAINLDMYPEFYEDTKDWFKKATSEERKGFVLFVALYGYEVDKDCPGTLVMCDLKYHYKGE